MKRKFPLFLLFFIIIAVLFLNFFHHQKQIFKNYDARLHETGKNYKRSNRFIVNPTTLWLESVNPKEHLTFATYRMTDSKNIFCLVLDCNETQNEIVLHPIDDGKSPVDIVMNHADRRDLHNVIDDYHAGTLDKRTTDKIIKIDITESIDAKMYGPPFPVANHVFAVAMNFPSHVKHDLAFDVTTTVRTKMGNAAPRIFFKFPPVAPPVKEITDKKSDHDSFLGAYDTIRYDRQIFIPSDDPALSYKTTDLKLDYEAEIGVVIGKQITHESAQTMTDEDMYAAIAGYVLVNDTKARNPQVMLKIINHNNQPAQDNPYDFHNETLNNVFGTWDEQTCRWWSYAATCNNFFSVGPFFVAAEDDRSSLIDIPFISARSYGTDRRKIFPEKYDRDTFYLRQSGVVTESATHSDALIWKLPQIIREIVRPGNPLAAIAGEQIILQPGDIICLGTPSGTALTSKPYPVFNFLKKVMFWVRPNKWHDMFFKGHQTEYLYPADHLFMWAEKLGFQQVDFERNE